MYATTAWWQSHGPEGPGSGSHQTLSPHAFSLGSVATTVQGHDTKQS